MSPASTATGADDAVAGPAAWTGFGATLIATALGLFAALAAALIVVDPYDTGRPGLIRAHGVPDQYPFTANASRARDPRFDAAIIGNSHVQALRPDRLSALTGMSFVTLMMPATWPLDQLRLLRWMIQARRTPPGALVIGTGDYWCRPTPVRSPNFPNWLYDPSFVGYAAGLVRYRSLEAAAARLSFLATGRGGARPDGYWDYAPYYLRLGLGDPGVLRARLAAAKPYEANPAGRFPGLDLLPAALRALPASTDVVLVVPPVHPTALPEPGSPAASDQRACRAALGKVAAGRPRTRVLDLQRPAGFAGEPEDFYDESHYRDAVAARVEQEIASLLAAMNHATSERSPSAGRI